MTGIERILANQEKVDRKSGAAAPGPRKKRRRTPWLSASFASKLVRLWPRVDAKFLRWPYVSGVALVFFALAVVLFAVTAPAVPRSAQDSGQAGSFEPISLTQDADEGAGQSTIDRSADVPYRVQAGETLSEIAFSYDITYPVLAAYNKISDPGSLKTGDEIVIPSADKVSALEKQLRDNPPPTAVSSAKGAAVLPARIEAHRLPGSRGVSVQFRILEPDPAKLREVEWDLGDGRKSFRPEPNYEYLSPKTYKVRLSAKDNEGKVYRSAYLMVDVPHPDSSADNTGTRYYTLSTPDEPFLVHGSVVKAARYDRLEDAPLDIRGQEDGTQQILFRKPGYYGLTVLSGDDEIYYSVFVSPVPTIHTDRSDLNWYRTQFNSGTPSNCGPSTVSMGIGFALGSYLPVADVRKRIGWEGDGGTSFEDLMKVFRENGVRASIQRLRTLQDLKDVIDAQGIAIVLFNTSNLEKGNSKGLFGRYYNDNVGHYIVIKGYSLDGKYLVAYDPIPSDWSSNSLRYDDEVSMLGRNRYYTVDSIFSSLRRAEAIVIPSSGS